MAGMALVGTSTGFEDPRILVRTVERFIVDLWLTDADEESHFLSDHLELINESFLDVLPWVFEEMTQGRTTFTQLDIAHMFEILGIVFWKFPRGIRWLNLEIQYQGL